MSFDDAKNQLIDDFEHVETVSPGRLIAICGEDDRLAELVREFVMFHDVATEDADGSLRRLSGGDSARSPQVRTASTLAETNAHENSSDAHSRFFVKVFGTEWGPLDFAGLKRMVEQGELSPTDSVRPASETEQWEQAQQMQGLFEPQTLSSDLELRDEIAEEMQAQIAEEMELFEGNSLQESDTSARDSQTDIPHRDEFPDAHADDNDRIAEDAPHQRTSPQTTHRPPPPPVSIEDKSADGVDFRETDEPSSLDSAVTVDPRDDADSGEDAEAPLADATSLAPATVASETKPSRLHFAGLYVWSHLRYNSILHVGLVVATVAGVFWNVFIAPPEKAALNVYQEVWAKLKVMRDAGASESEWNRFTVDATDEIESVVARLESSASADEPARQELLWAGDLFLRRMLSDARVEPSRSEGLFVQHFEKAKSIMSGTEPEYGNDERPAGTDTIMEPRSPLADPNGNPKLDDSRVAN